MKQMHVPCRLMLSASVAAVVAIAGLSASAQTTTTTTSTSCQPGNTTSPHAGNLTTATQGSATPQMMREACQRQRARTAKFLQCGIPEMFGSEEPFTFNPNTPCP